MVQGFRSGAAVAGAFAAALLTTGVAGAADLRAAARPVPVPIVSETPFFVNISGMFGSYNMFNTRTDIFSAGPAGGFDGQFGRSNGANFTGGVLATFQPLAPFHVAPFFGFLTPVFQVGYFGDVNNTSSSVVFGLNPATRGTGFAQVTTRSAIPLLGGVSFSLRPLGFEFFNSTTVQLTAGVQITQRSASFGLAEFTTAGVPVTGGLRRWSRADPTIAVGTITPLPINTPFGQPTLTNHFTLSQSRTTDVLAPAVGAPTDFYRLRARSGAEIRATSGIGFSFGGAAAPVVARY